MNLNQNLNISCILYDRVTPPPFTLLWYIDCLMLASMPTYGLDEHLRSCREEFSHKIIMGDFNKDLIEPNAVTRALFNFADKHSLEVVEHGA